jgi:hypothetical protein
VPAPRFIKELEVLRFALFDAWLPHKTVQTFAGHTSPPVRGRMNVGRCCESALVHERTFRQVAVMSPSPPTTDIGLGNHENTP